MTLAAPGLPVPASGAGQTMEGPPRDPQASARRALRVARAFAGVAFAMLMTWPLVEGPLPARFEMAGDLALGFALVAGALGVGMYSRKANVAAEHALRVEAEELARRDELSGLYNIRHLRERLRAEVAEGARDGAGFALVLFDLDNFKDINDRFGHLAGDGLIASIGQIMRDAVNGNGLAARQGGDEFAILLPGVNRSAADALATEIAARISDASLAAVPRNAHLRVTASHGTALFPADGASAEALTAAADRALYRAKARAMGAHARTTAADSQGVFFAIGEAIRASDDAGDVLNNICRAVGQQLSLDSCSIWMLQANDAFRFRAYYTRDPEFERRMDQILDSTPKLTRAEATASGLLRDHAVYVDDVHAAEVLPARFRAPIDPDTWLIAVPIASSHGGLMLLSAKHDRCAPPDTGLALAVAQLTSVAIRNADTFARARQQGERLAQLGGIAAQLLGEGSYEDRLAAVVQRIFEITGFDHVTLDTSDPTGVEPFFRSFCARGYGNEPLPEAAAELWRTMKPQLTEERVATFLATLKQPLILRDPVVEAGEYYREVIIQSGINMVVVLPVTWQGELKGVLYFSSYRKDGFDDHDIALMHTIAAQLAPAIQVATLHVELEHSYGELKDAHLQALLRLAYAAEARDPYTECHLQRIRAVAQAIARRWGIEGDELEALGYGAVVHDLGKLRIPDSILMNPGSLSDDEWAQMKKHPLWGAEIIGDNAFYDVARQVALHHHERWDGSGYPFGLKGDEIPLAARIVSVADVYDALTTQRPYKSAWPAERALVELMKIRGRTLCPRSVDIFMELWREGEIQRIDEETMGESMEVDFRQFYAA